jgi:hypothetical protein
LDDWHRTLGFGHLVNLDVYHSGDAWHHLLLSYFNETFLLLRYTISEVKRRIE